MAAKIYESIRKRSTDFNELDSVLPFDSDEDQFIINLDIDMKSNVYDLVRSNPGNKNLYMKIIEAILKIDYNLALEVFNLIYEQQLRIHTILEEI